jgi:hypothetical protein
MDEQTNTNDNEKPTQNKSLKFNWALFLGCCVIALSIYSAGGRIATRIPHSLHGNLHGNFSGTLTGNNDSFQEFMSEWEAARFLGMSRDEFTNIVATGELSGTYTVFQVERTVWNSSGGFVVTMHGSDGLAAVQPIEQETVIVDHRVFSRERLVEWLLNRMDE